jgi:moderate conductance mechanosensitive channel
MQQLINAFSNAGSGLVSIVIITGILYIAGPFAIRFIIHHTIRRTKQRIWQQKDIEKRENTIVALFINIWKLLIAISAAAAIIMLFFPDTSLAPLFASAGVVGIAVGFGAQSMAKDFLTGLFIISENQFRVGDVIEIDGSGGTVERIGTRSTVLRDVDGNVHYFPNGMIQHVINKTMGYSMARFTITVHPDEDIERVIELINAAGQELADDPLWHKKILEAPKFSVMSEFNANGVSLVIAGKTQPSDQWSVTAAMRRKLLETFETHNIKLGTTPVAPVATMSKKR